MRDFCKFSPDFWSGTLADKLKALGRDALLLAAYLQTNRHANMLGVYYLPLVYASYDTGIPEKEIENILDALAELNFCYYDAQFSYIWVVELGFIQSGGPLKGHDKRVSHLQKQYMALPRVFYLPSMYEKYHEAYHLRPIPAELHPLQSPLEGPSMPLRSKKKNKKKEKKNKKEKNIHVESLTSSMGHAVDSIQTIFKHWQTTFNHPQAKLDTKRSKLIQQALASGYDVDSLCQAITGCSLTPHNIGHNEAGQIFDGLHIILRDSDQIDRFIRNATNPPRKASVSLLERNQAAMEAWIAQEEQKDAVL